MRQCFDAETHSRAVAFFPDKTFRAQDDRGNATAGSNDVQRRTAQKRHKLAHH